MICLNYHRIDSTPEADFYTVSPIRFANQLEKIRAAGFRSIRVNDLLDARSDEKIVMLHFDDGTEGHFRNVLPILEAAGMKGVFFISTAKVGQPGYLSTSQISEMAEAGHDIECHGHSHRRMDTMTEKILGQELAESVRLITGWTGRSPRILAPPGGFLNPRIVAVAERNGMQTIRTMRWKTNRLPIAGELDCLVVTGATGERTLAGWLNGRGMLRLRAAYLAKQTVRSLIPFSLYLKLRNLLRHR